MADTPKKHHLKQRAPEDDINLQQELYARAIGTVNSIEALKKPNMPAQELLELNNTQMKAQAAALRSSDRMLHIADAMVYRMLNPKEGAKRVLPQEDIRPGVLQAAREELAKSYGGILNEAL